jgi:hypothetical protein
MCVSCLIGFVVYLTMARNRKCLLVSLEEVNVIVELDEKLVFKFYKRKH